MENNNTNGNNNNNNDKGGTIFAVVVMIIFVALYFVSCGGSGSKSGRKWSDLSETEKANARWAYEAKQYIDSID